MKITHHLAKLRARVLVALFGSEWPVAQFFWRDVPVSVFVLNPATTRYCQISDEIYSRYCSWNWIMSYKCCCTTILSMLWQSINTNFHITVSLLRGATVSLIRYSDDKPVMASSQTGLQYLMDNKYTQWTVKKRDILFLTITLANRDRFLQFLYHFNREEILHATVVKFTTSP